VRRVAFHPEARDELIAAARVYESHSSGLGLEFILAVQRTYERLRRHPGSGHPFGRRLRRLLLPKFPYGVLYQVEADLIYIVAVMHLRRRPGYWRSRI